MTITFRRHRTGGSALVAAIVVALMPLAGAQGASAAVDAETGFALPYAGPEKYLPYAPVRAPQPGQINQRLGQARADSLAASLGFRKDRALTPEQYTLFVTGQGVGGGGPDAMEAAELTNASLTYLTNTTTKPIYRDIDGKRTRVVLGSYGLIVDENGILMSPAYNSSPVRQINWVLAPQPVCDTNPPPTLPPGMPQGTCGYLGRWMLANGAEATLAELYASAYTEEVPFGSQSQQVQEPAELVPNTANGTSTWVGMAMAPSIWIVNFLLIYALNPSLAAEMPAYWAPIPPNVAQALIDAGGTVPYAQYEAAFRGRPLR